eukprot:scaffold9620_cov197-Amphora_coffeaeformis.AAC.9
MEKPVRLHVAARKYWEPSYAGMAPGCQMSTWMMANGDETGQEVREDAVWTTALPGGDVEAEPVPVEPKVDAMEGLEIAEVAGGGRRVEDVEDPASEGCGRDDEEKGTTGAAEWLAVDEVAILDGDEAFPQWGLVGGWGVLEEGAGEAVIGIRGQGSEDIMEFWVVGIPGGPFGWGGETGSQDAGDNVLRRCAGVVEE